MLKILLENLVGYDLIIFVFGGFNFLLFFRIIRGLRVIENDFTRTSYLQNQWLFDRAVGQDGSEVIKDMRSQMDSFTKRKSELDFAATFYVSMTGIFPLLGILGTVVSLLTLGDFTSNLAAIGFSKALTSTFWGILFGAISKFGEGFFAAKLDSYDKLYHEIRLGFIKAGKDNE